MLALFMYITHKPFDPPMKNHSYRSFKVFADQPMKIFDTNINIKDF